MAQQTHCLQSGDENAFTSSLYSLNNVRATIVPRLTVQLLLNKQPHVMEVDSGAAFSLISEHTFHCLWPVNPPSLVPEETRLQTWTGQSLRMCGKTMVTVELLEHVKQLPLRVVEGTGASLLGRDWFPALEI